MTDRRPLILGVYPWTLRLLALLGGLSLMMLMLQAIPPTADLLQHIDDRVLAGVKGSRVEPATWLAHALDLIGSAWVTVPLRVGVVALLVIRRRWWFLSAFLVAVAASEFLITVLKLGYARVRPSSPLVTTTGFSFPSGHTMAAAVLAVMLVLVFVHPGRRRRIWIRIAVLFTVLMGLSRVYLAAHWMSDALTSALLGSTVALGSAVLIQVIHDRRAERAAVDRGPLEDAGTDEREPHRESAHRESA